MANVINLSVYSVEDVHEVVFQNFYRSPKMIHPYPLNTGGSSHPSDNSRFTFYFLQHLQFGKASRQSEIRLCPQAKFVMIVTIQLLIIPRKRKHLIFSAVEPR